MQCATKYAHLVVCYVVVGARRCFVLSYEERIVMASVPESKQELEERLWVS